MWILMFALLCNGVVVKQDKNSTFDTKGECEEFVVTLKELAKIGNEYNPSRGNVTVNGFCIKEIR